MAAGRYLLTIEQGATTDLLLEYKDSNGSPVDLSGYAARMQIRPSVDSSTTYLSITNITSSDGTGLNLTPVSSSVTLPQSSGSIGLFISAASSSALTFSEGVYDVELESSTGIVTRLLEGIVKLSKEVTR
jgi:hypothetical protein